MRKRHLAEATSFVLALVVVASSLIGCGAARPAPSLVMADVMRSGKPRLPAPSLSATAVRGLIAGNTEFALDLYQGLFNGEENLLYSPYSLSVALAMIYAGARGETERQMAEALYYTLPQTELHAAFNALDGALSGRDKEERDDGFRLGLANAVWGQQGYQFLDAYLDVLAENYGVGLWVVDFGQSEKARRIINEWVNNQVERRIGELLPPGAIDAETVLVLTNVITFKGVWKQAFDKGRTQDGSFALLDGSRITVPMMSRLTDLGYAEHPGVQIVELPYAGDRLSMVILLPEQGNFEAFARSLDPQKVDALLRKLDTRRAPLTIPKFGLHSTFELKDALSDLGMVDAFREADFSGIDGTRELYIDQVYHSAQLGVDEAGAEALAAASAKVMAKRGTMLEQEVRVDRPFIFLIRDVENGTILFFGHVVNPST